MKIVLTTLAKNVLVLLGLTAAPSATDALIPKNIFELGMTALIISNKEMEDIMKIVEFFEELGLLSVSETIKNEAKEQKGGFPRRLLGTLATSILGNMLAGKPNISGQGVIKADEEVIRAGEGTISAG